jgi:hypothetical protein
VRWRHDHLNRRPKFSPAALLLVSTRIEQSGKEVE